MYNSHPLLTSVLTQGQNYKLQSQNNKLEIATKSDTTHCD